MSTTPLGNASAVTIHQWVTDTLTQHLPELPTLWATDIPVYAGNLISLLEQEKAKQQQLLDAIKNTVEPPTILLLALQTHTANVCVRIALQPFSSYQQAQAAQLAMNDLITNVLEYEPLRETYTSVELSAWNDLRVKIANAIRQQQMILPVIKHIQISQALPAVVIAHQLFQDAERADQLIKQNGCEHPGFCAGTLEYLSTE